MDSYKKKNILFITNLHLWSLDANKGGRAFYLTVDGYIKSGWNVILISTGGNIPSEIYENATVYEKRYEIIDKWIASPILIVSIFSRYLQFILHNWFYYEKAVQVLQKLDNRNTVVYAYEVAGVKSAKRISKKFKIPLVTRFQGTVLSKIPNTWINRLRRTPHFGALKTAADLVIMTNDGTQGNRVLSFLGNKSEKIVFWRNGVDGVDQYIGHENLSKRQSENSDFSTSRFVFLTVSRLVDWKRVHLAIEGLAKLTQRYPNAELVIVGDGDERKRLENLTESLNLRQKVTFMGAVEQSEVRNVMRKCDAFLSFYDLSNLGNPIMEAMISGLPIITIDVGDTGELIKDNKNGLLIPADRLEKIPLAMEQILINRELRSRLSNGALETALSEFITWEQRIDNELKMVQKLIGGAVI